MIKLKNVKYGNSTRTICLSNHQIKGFNIPEKLDENFVNELESEGDGSITLKRFYEIEQTLLYTIVVYLIDGSKIFLRSFDYNEIEMWVSELEKG